MGLLQETAPDKRILPKDIVQALFANCFFTTFADFEALGKVFRIDTDGYVAIESVRIFFPLNVGGTLFWVASCGCSVLRKTLMAILKRLPVFSDIIIGPEHFDEHLARDKSFLPVCGKIF